MWGRSKSEMDSDSFRRSAIEAHEQEHHRESLDVVIDAVRDSLEWLAQQKDEILNFCVNG